MGSHQTPHLLALWPQSSKDPQHLFCKPSGLWSLDFGDGLSNMRAHFAESLERHAVSRSLSHQYDSGQCIMNTLWKQGWRGSSGLCHFDKGEGFAGGKRLMENQRKIHKWRREEAFLEKIMRSKGDIRNTSEQWEKFLFFLLFCYRKGIFQDTQCQER